MNGETVKAVVEAASKDPILPPQSNRPALPKWRLACVSVSVSIGLFLSLLDTTIVATALFTIGEDLNAVGSINWVALAYTLSYLGCAVIFARISDIIGRRNAYMAALIIFIGFSLGCGFARTLEQLIALRVLQGIGGSGLYSLAFVILPEISPPHMAQMISGIAGMVVAMAGILGPVLGGIITHYSTWRWIFWINAPIGIVAVILFAIAWPKANQLRHAQRRPWKQLDVVGAVLVIAASVLVVFSFQEAGLHHNNWRTALFIAPLIFGCLCYVLLFVWEYLVAKYWEGSFATMFPLRLIKRRIYMGYVLVTLIGGFPYFMIIYSLPLRFQVVNERSQLIAGLALLPMVGTVAISSTAAAVVNQKRNLMFYTLLIGSLCSVIGAATLSTLKNVDWVESKMYGFQIFIGLGFGLMVSTTSMGGGMECEFRDNTVAQGIIAQVRVLGGSIGIATSSAILGANQQRKLTGIVTSAQLATFEDSMSSLTPEQLDIIKQTYSDSFSESMKVCAAIAGLGVLATFVVFRRRPVDFMENRKQQIMEDMARRRREGETAVVVEEKAEP
ncbi:MFS multidrug transporter-like protein [Amylocarpus encephaloides]|uniref:MFS multidrug transporter-like protein n=1 Tax=Amylocarpus encephaloides TaxID=45428 RepID=A0A9P8C9R4_9HELO|nr:MFS multidrug transporter-like protein [Amylocarpus encephaloides]